MKRLNEKRRQRFAREFPGLDQIPGFEKVERIKVLPVSANVLESVGEMHRYDSPRLRAFDSFTVYYAVYGGGIVEVLRANYYIREFDSSARILVDAQLSNGEQIFRNIFVGPPDFMVRSENGRIWTILKTKKFDWEEYFEGLKSPSPRFEDPNSILEFRRRRWA